MFFQHISLLCLATTVIATPARLASGLHHRRHVTHESSLFSRLSANVLTRDDCEPADPQNTVTDRLNTLLNSSGPGYTLPLCPSESYYITAPLQFAAHDQEISTAGYPVGDERAILVVSGAITDGVGQTSAVIGQCSDCDGIKLRHIQINGTRGTNGPISGGANIEMGGDNSGQLIEYVHSFDPRGWSCLHIAEGTFKCNDQTIQNNDIGPCGTDAFQQWADGISVSCMNTIVRNNMINNPTDGGIVLFGAPGSLVENNTIWVENNTLLGGINMVDYDPWSGNYTGTVVRNNLIMGGFATSDDEPGDSDGTNAEDVIIKIGIAIGPRTWFGNQYFQNVSSSGSVLYNNLTGAFGYALAMSSARNFTVQGNILVGNTSFIGRRGPNCTDGDTTPNPAAFVIDPSLVTDSNEQSGFVTVSDGDGLTCIQPPDGGDYWPFGGNPSSPDASNSSPSSPSSSPSSSSSSTSSGLSGGAKAGIAIGVILGVAAIAAATYYIRRWALARAQASGVEPWRMSGYLGNGKAQ